jgi:hypothetical protein
MVEVGEYYLMGNSPATAYVLLVLDAEPAPGHTVRWASVRAVVTDSNYSGVEVGRVGQWIVDTDSRNVNRIDGPLLPSAPKIDPDQPAYVVQLKSIKRGDRYVHPEDRSVQTALCSYAPAVREWVIVADYHTGRPL